MGNTISKRAFGGILTAGLWGVLAIAAAVAPMAQPIVAAGPASVVVAAETPAHTDTPGNGWGG